jgi:hypothetical protein
VLLILDDSSIIGRLGARWESGLRSWWLMIDGWSNADS